MIHWMQAHQVISTLVAYILFLNAVNAMPSPDAQSGKGYRFLFNFLHGILLNLMRLPAFRSLFGNSGQQPPSPPINL